MLAVGPLVGLHSRADQLVITLIQPVQHRPQVQVIQPQVKYIVLPESLVEGEIVHPHLLVLLEAGDGGLWNLPAVGHHQGIVAVPLAGVDYQSLVVLAQLGHQLVEEHGGVLIDVGFHVPQVVIPLFHLRAVAKRAELAPPHGVGHHVHTNPKGQLPELVLLGRRKQLLAR